MTQFLGETFTHQNPTEYGEGKKVTTKILTTDAENTENLNKRLTNMEQNNTTPTIQHGHTTATLTTQNPNLQVTNITTQPETLHTKIIQDGTTQTIHKYLANTNNTTYTYTIKTPTEANLAGSTSTVQSNSPIGQYCTATNTEVPSFNNDSDVIVWITDEDQEDFIRWCQENLNIIVKLTGNEDMYTIYKQVHTITTFKSTTNNNDTNITEYTHNKIEGTIVIDTAVMNGMENNTTITLVANNILEVDFPDDWQLANRREVTTLTSGVDTVNLQYPVYTSGTTVMMQVYKNNTLQMIDADYTLIDEKTIQLTSAAEDDLIEVVYNTTYSQTYSYQVYVEAVLTEQVQSVDVEAYYAYNQG